MKCCLYVYFLIVLKKSQKPAIQTGGQSGSILARSQCHLKSERGLEGLERKNFKIETQSTNALQSKICYYENLKVYLKIDIAENSNTDTVINDPPFI